MLLLLEERVGTTFGLVLKYHADHPHLPDPDPVEYAQEDDPGAEFRKAVLALEPGRWRALCYAERITTEDELYSWLRGDPVGVT